MTACAFLNGRFVPEIEARVGIDDAGWLHGAGLFETIRAENGRLFRLERHIQRMRQSAEVLLRPIPREQLPSEQQLCELLERNQLKAARVRLTVTAGAMRAISEQPTTPTVFATAISPGGHPPDAYERGVSVIVSKYRQSTDDPTVGHKTICYLPRLLALRHANEARCAEAIWFTHQHELAEGSISNVFIVRDGTLKTPALDTPVLPGIARETVLEVAAALGIDARQCRLTINDLLDADECFLTNTMIQVLPVVRVERRNIASAAVGSMTKRIGRAYRELVETECR